MYRSSTISAAFVAGAALWLAACSGETPTSPKPAPTPSGACASTITLPAGPIVVYTSPSSKAIVYVTIPAQVKTNGQAVPDNSSVSFSIQAPGAFAENGLQTLVGSTKGSVASASPWSVSTGVATLTANFGCASASVEVDFSPCPTCLPFISTVNPATGSAAGGDAVTISGLHFTDFPLSTVTFGGVPVSPDASPPVSNTSISVHTPAHTLANPQVPETVDVCATFFGGVAKACLPQSFTYVGVNPNQKISISSISPTAGSQAGGDAVTVFGSNFGTSPATTRVTFCGLPATVTSVASTSIGVLTPVHVNSPSSLSFACDVVATIDLGKVSQQSAVLPQAFTYRGGGGTGTCNSDPSLFISAISPNTGPPSGGTTVAISGGGFPTVPANVRVDFGGIPASVTSVSATSIGVVTPQFTLANPSSPQTVDVTVTDLGSANQRCARLAGSFTYTVLALVPTIYSISPVTGPNSSPTRVTIFGTGFQFPEQVFVVSSTGSCGTPAPRFEASVVSPITLSQIVFDTPTAIGAYSCLAGSLTDVVVLNPTTGKQATCPGCFKYYGCPTASSVSPSVIPADATTLVTVTGTNFASPVQATFVASGLPTYQPNVISVSATSVIVQMPPLSTIATGLPACQSYAGTLSLQSTSLSCSPVQVTVTYHAYTPTATSVSPTSLPQTGGSVTVLGSNFGSQMTVAVTNEGSFTSAPVIATVTNSGSLTFTAPFVPDTSFNRQNCSTGGTQAIPTVFGIRVTNTQTGCTFDYPGALTYNPTNTTCSATLTISTSSLPPAVVCSGYSQSIGVTGGTPPYFNYTASGLPTGLSINLATGLISGTPVLAAPGAGGSVPMSVLVGVEDTAATTTSKAIPILFSDPFGPFTVTGTPTQHVPANGAGPASALSVVGGTGNINWSIDSISPPLAPGILTIVTPALTSNFVGSSLPAGTYTVTVRATDSLCAPAHTSTVTVTVISP